MKMFLSNFGLGVSAKFYVAAAMAVLMFLRQAYGLDLGLSEEAVTAIIGAVGAFLVWLVPNRPTGIL